MEVVDICLPTTQEKKGYGFSFPLKYDFFSS